ncbi:hypothetical protein CHARACLAT_005694 [Characodon lateralis]|uniref:Uncharacterized protein n=1 Tax=Characodon lateralis TaxID=208331 RepID=A0ABU7CXC7_9TELE|nr:hypothetical protein [Characodon lateralis]
MDGYFISRYLRGKLCADSTHSRKDFSFGSRELSCLDLFLSVSLLGSARTQSELGTGKLNKQATIASFAGLLQKEK